MLMGHLQAIPAILMENANILLYIIVAQGAFGLIIRRLLRTLAPDTETLSCLSFSGGILALTLFCLLAGWMKLTPRPGAGFLLILIAGIVVLWSVPSILRNWSWHNTSLAAFFVFILGLRLVFIESLLVPPYADSLEHTRIVQDMLEPQQPAQAFYGVGADLQTYYHLGFHAVAAWLSGSFGSKPVNTILFLGQYFQAMAAFSMYPLAQIALKKRNAAWGVMLLPSLLLPMPAYASNWGKYPAIASLTGFLFCVSLLLLLCESRKKSTTWHWLLLGLAFLSTFSLHTRVAPAFLAVGLSFFVYRQLGKFVLDGRVLFFACFAIIGLIAFVDLFNNQLLAILFVCTLLLALPAFYARFKLTWALLVFVFITYIFTKIHLPAELLPARFETILDRPFVNILFFVPASFIIWIGLEGLAKFLHNMQPEVKYRIILFVILCAGLVNTLLSRNFMPSPCCIFMDENDLFVFQWMKHNLPENTLIGIAATGIPGNYLVSDGGAWIEPFTELATRKLPPNLDFVFETVHLCNTGIRYIYADGLENSFDEYSLVQAGADYLIGIGPSRVYELPCP